MIFEGSNSMLMNEESQLSTVVLLRKGFALLRWRLDGDVEMKMCGWSRWSVSLCENHHVSA
jgi:hypothetical protein